MELLSKLKNKNVLLNSLALYGAYSVGTNLLKQLWEQISDYRMSNQEYSYDKERLLERYGRGSYVLITGATTISGKALSKEFALAGFNLVLIDESQDNLKALEKEILLINKSLKVKLIRYDFSFQSNFDDIFVEIEDLDISILVNNAELKHLSLFIHASDKDIDDLITHNIFALVFMTKQFIKSIEQDPRGQKKSAVITITSNSLFLNHPYLTAYSGSKRFSLIFSESLKQEVNPQNIEIYTFISGFLRDQSNEHLLKNYSTLQFPRAKEFAQSVLQSIQKPQTQNYTFLHWRHQQEVKNVQQSFEASWTLGAFNLFRKLSKLYFIQEQLKQDY